MKRGRIASIVFALLVVAALVWGFSPRPIEVDIATVEQGPLIVTVEEEGKTRVMDRYIISAPMSGYARRIDLREGDALQPGQVVAVLEPSRSDALDPRSRAQARAQLSAAEAALAGAQAQAQAAKADTKLAEQEIERTERLRKSNFLSQSAVDQARNKLNRLEALQKSAEHSVNMSRYERDAARAALARTDTLQAGGSVETLDVRAPVKARVLKLVHKSEGMVQAGQPLLEIGNPEALEVEVELLSTHAVKIAPGSKVILDRWGGEGSLMGAVRVIEPSGFTKISALGVEEQRVRVIADFTSPRDVWQRLGDGYRVEASFVVWEGKDVLQVPTSALFRHNSGWAVFVIEDEKARLQPVEIGQRTGLRAQVLSGLKAGMKVIAHPDDKMKDGARVKPRKT